MTLARGAFLDRDFVLNVGGLAGRSLAVVARDGEGYVALASFCADVPRDASALPFRLKLLVDCSGSMAGDSMRGRHAVRCTASWPRSRRPTGSRSRASAARSCTRPGA